MKATETPKKPWYSIFKTAAFPWILILLSIYGGGMLILGWNLRSTDMAQFDSISSQISDLKDNLK